MDKLKKGVSQEIMDLTGGYTCRFLRNRQIRITVDGGYDDCMRVRTAINTWVRRDSVKVRDKEPYAMVEQSPERAQSNAMLAKAMAGLQKIVGNATQITPDWAGSSIHAGEQDTMLGKIDPKSGIWKWFPTHLQVVWPGKDVTVDQINRVIEEGED
jgi:hypothetical protein